MTETPGQYDVDISRQRTDDEALCRVARARFQQAEEAEHDQRQLSLDDLRFRGGEQWPRDVEQVRTIDRRPCLTINRLPQFIRQVINDVRQNPPSIKVSPVDSGTDPETAKVMQGIIRHIELDSNADTAYQTAMEAAVTHGRGYFRVLTEYTSPISFEQEIKFQRVRNPFAVYVDPTCQTPDYSDMQWAFIVQTMAREHFRQQYPDAEASQMDQWTSTGDTWIERDQVRIAEYWYIDYKRQTIALLDDGMIVRERDIQGRPVREKRLTQIPTVYWCKINGYEVLERTEWPGRWIPIIPVLGEELDIEGKVTLSGLVRYAKDSQRMYNYWVSSETETIALAPRAPWIGAEGQFEGHERQWLTANQRNWPYLEYKIKSVDGRPVGPPQRNVFEPPIQAISQARLLAADDLKATTGIYDAALGARSNEISGRAILSRQRESDTATFHYPANLAIAMRHAGRILIDLIPAIYNRERVVRIVGEDGDERQVTVNAPYQDEAGVERLYDLASGKYDVVVHTGPSFASKRQEAVDAMVQISQAYPQLLQVAGDLFVKNMDWPGAQEIASRLRKTIPREVLDEEGASPEDQVQQLRATAQQLQQQLEAIHAYAQQCEQQAQELAQENAKLQQNVNLKEQELQLKNDLETQKLALEAQKLELERIKLLLDAESDDSEARQALGALEQRLQTLEVSQRQNGAVREE